MRGISLFIAETLNTNGEFITLSNSLAGDQFTFYVNVDLDNAEVVLPYFAVVTFQDTDDVEVRKFYRTQILMGIERSKPVNTNGIVEESTLANLESLSRKAIELLRAELRTFGVQGDKNIRVAYVSYFVPNPEGEDDLQMQIDIEFEQDKFLSC